MSLHSLPINPPARAMIIPASVVVVKGLSGPVRTCQGGFVLAGCGLRAGMRRCVSLCCTAWRGATTVEGQGRARQGVVEGGTEVGRVPIGGWNRGLSRRKGGVVEVGRELSDVEGEVVVCSRVTGWKLGCKCAWDGRLAI